MTSREVVKRTLSFQGPDRYAFDFPEPFGSDFYFTGIDPSPDARPRQGLDDWGCLWECLGTTQLGEVKDSPLKDWKNFDKLTVPVVGRDDAFKNVRTAKENAGDKYILGNIMSMYERVHFVRGLENTWCDIIDQPNNLKMFVGMLADINIEILDGYKGHGLDGVIFCDDWGLQNRLMISPESWRAIWKPEYKRVFDAARREGLDVWMHSCGYISDIIEDLIEIGLGAIHMDQQNNMDLDLLGRDFRGRITFFSPVDIQLMMKMDGLAGVRAYCRRMSQCLGTKEGGFIPRWYSDPVGVGHTKEYIDAMCEEFLTISREIYGK